MEIGHLFMTNEQTNKTKDISQKSFKKLSIQVGLNGLSFCIVDSVSNKIVASDSVEAEDDLNPAEMLNTLEDLIKRNSLQGSNFDDVMVVHSNTLFTLVPKPLFIPDEAESYLKFNTKIFSTDAISYDELEHQDIVNVYIPFMNVNNFVYDLYGEFTYMHNGTVIIQSLLQQHSASSNAVCYVHVGKKQMDVTVVKQKQLLLYNSFIYETKDDFIYYLLFVLEQLDVNLETISVKLFGSIEEDDPIYELCYLYIKNICIFVPSTPHHLQLGDPEANSIDFTILNTL